MAQKFVGDDLSSFVQFAVNNIVAKAGGTQAAATPLTGQVNRVVTVASAGDSVLLPPSVPGTNIIVINSGANALQVFGAGTDTVNDVPTATGVSQIANSIEIYSCPVAGKWYVKIGTGFAGSFMTESTQQLVANAGGGAAGATQINAQIAEIITVATALDSAKLPPAQVGVDLFVVNHGANPAQIFASGTDTIDDVAQATGVTMMQNSVVLFTCVVAGKWYANGLGSGFAQGFPTVSFANGLTAFAGGGQANATLITTCIARFTTVATIADSAKLPVSSGGMVITVTNAGAQSMNLFPNAGESINALGANAAFAVPAGKTAQLTCAVAGQWHSVLSA